MSLMAYPKCKRCGKEIVLHAKDSESLFESMHWLCFHLEFEHLGDPDEPCSDYSCPQFKLKIFQDKLSELGLNPEKILEERIKKDFGFSI